MQRGHQRALAPLGVGGLGLHASQTLSGDPHALTSGWIGNDREGDVTMMASGTQGQRGHHAQLGCERYVWDTGAGRKAAGVGCMRHGDEHRRASGLAAGEGALTEVPRAIGYQCSG